MALTSMQRRFGTASLAMYYLQRAIGVGRYDWVADMVELMEELRKIEPNYQPPEVDENLSWAMSDRERVKQLTKAVEWLRAWNGQTRGKFPMLTDEGRKKEGLKQRIAVDGIKFTDNDLRLPQPKGFFIESVSVKDPPLDLDAMVTIRLKSAQLVPTNDSFYRNVALLLETYLPPLRIMGVE